MEQTIQSVQVGRWQERWCCSRLYIGGGVYACVGVPGTRWGVGGWWNVFWGGRQRWITITGNIVWWLWWALLMRPWRWWCWWALSINHGGGGGDGYQYHQHHHHSLVVTNETIMVVVLVGNTNDAMVVVIMGTTN